MIKPNPAKVAQRAAEIMAEHKFGCSGAVVLAFQEELGEAILPPAAMAMSQSFRGGLGAGCLCGALAGAEMVLGATFGYRGQAGGTPSQAETTGLRALSKELHDRFTQAHHHTCCRSLTAGLIAQSPEMKEKCQGLVKSAATLAAELIERES